MSNDQTTAGGPKIEAVALAKAADAWTSQTSWDWSSDGLEAACWAFHEHMAQPLRASLREADSAMKGAGWGSSHRARLRIAEALKNV